MAKQDRLGRALTVGCIVVSVLGGSLMLPMAGAVAAAVGAGVVAKWGICLGGAALFSVATAGVATFIEKCARSSSSRHGRPETPVP